MSEQLDRIASSLEEIATLLKKPLHVTIDHGHIEHIDHIDAIDHANICLLYTSDAADE